MRPSPEEIAQRVRIFRDHVGDALPASMHNMLAASAWLGEQFHRIGLPIELGEIVGRAFGGRCLHADPWDVAEAMFNEHIEAHARPS